MSAKTQKLDPKLDLMLERVVDVPPNLVWKAWTVPEHIKKCFTPAPWTTIDCEVELRPGGIFRTTMRSPEGQEFPNMGCFLEVIPNERLVWTSALLPGFRPAQEAVNGADNLLFTATILLEAQGKGTKYTAICIHRNESDCEKHRNMGFSDGWGKALDQLVAHAKTM